jgi:hypothetical protein
VGKGDHMKKIHPHDVGLIAGVTVCLMHVVWSLAVMLGLASWYLDFIFSLHFVSNPYVVQSFDLGKAVMLWVITFVAGYLLGWVSGVIWNMLLKKR